MIRWRIPPWYLIAALLAGSASAAELDRESYQRSLDAGDCDGAEALVLAQDAAWQRMSAALDADADMSRTRELFDWYQDVAVSHYPALVFCRARAEIASAREVLAALGEPPPYYNYDDDMRTVHVDELAGLRLEGAVYDLAAVARSGYAPAIHALAVLYDEGKVFRRSPNAVYVLLSLAGRLPEGAAALKRDVSAELTVEERARLDRYVADYKDGVLEVVDRLDEPKIWMESPALILDGACRLHEAAAILRSPELRHLKAPTRLESRMQRAQRFEALEEWHRTRRPADYPVLESCMTAR